MYRNYSTTQGIHKFRARLVLLHPHTLFAAIAKCRAFQVPQSDGPLVTATKRNNWQWARWATPIDTLLRPFNAWHQHDRYALSPWAALLATLFVCIRAWHLSVCKASIPLFPSHIPLLSTLFILYFPPTAISQDKRPTDLEQYYAQVEANNFDKYSTIYNHLLESTPPEQLMLAYIERKFNVLYDTVSLFDWLQPGLLPEEKRVDLANQCDKLASKHGCKALGRVAQLIRLDLMNESNQYEQKVDGLEELIRQCQKAGDKAMEAHCLHYLFNSSLNNDYRHAVCFAYASRLAKALDTLANEYPLKRKRYIELAIAYYRFKDYDRFRRYMNQSAGWKPRSALHSDTKGMLYGYSHLANYYRLKGDLDSATFYLRITLANKEAQSQNSMYFDIALCDLGYVEMQRGNDELAFTLLQVGATHMKDKPMAKDYINEVYLTLANYMLAKDNLPEMRRYIDMVNKHTYECPTSVYMQRLSNLYALECKYYNYMRQYAKAALYFDSAMTATIKVTQFTGKQFIIQGEQLLMNAELARQKQEVEYQRKLIYAGTTSILVASIALLGIAHLYRKRNKAYKVLVSQAEEWAKAGHETPSTPATVPTDQEQACSKSEAEGIVKVNGSSVSPTSDNTTELCKNKSKSAGGSSNSMNMLHKEKANAEDLQIMTLVEQIMNTGHAYREQGLTVERLANRTGIHRNKLSSTVNRVTGNNLSHYLNTYRVKEAVRIMMDSNTNQINIDELYERVGFGNRTSFYTSFKQFTGLTPAEFLTKKGAEESEEEESSGVMRGDEVSTRRD